MLSREFIQKVKDATDLKALVEEYTELMPAGTNLWQGHCPHPDHEDSTPSFRLCHDKNGWSWYCGGCHMGPKDLKANPPNYGSDCFAFVSWMSDYKGSKHKIGWREAVEILAKRAGIPMPSDKNDAAYKMLYTIARTRHQKLMRQPKALRYLFSRGLTKESIDKWLLGYQENMEFGQQVPRVSFPLFTRYNRVVGESSRAITWNKDKTYPKYRNSSNSELFHKRKYLYGLNFVDTSTPELRITEGAMDVDLASQYGVKNVVCTLGTAFSEDHIQIIANMRLIPCFCLDGDAAGQKGIRRATDMLYQHGIVSKICVLPEGKDLADMALELKDELEEYIEKHTISYWEYLLKDTFAYFDSKVNDLRRECLPAILKATESVKDEKEKTIMISYVKARFGISL